MGRGGGEGVDVGECGRWEDKIDIPLIQSNSRVGLIGTVESSIGTNWCTDVRVINTNTMYDWYICNHKYDNDQTWESNRDI